LLPPQAPVSNMPAAHVEQLPQVVSVVGPQAAV
jgi:hypothetical protein